MVLNLQTDCILHQEMQAVLELETQQRKLLRPLSEPHLELVLVVPITQLSIQIFVEQQARVLQLQVMKQLVCILIFALHLERELVVQAT
jgi:hypothetical protein